MNSKITNVIKTTRKFIGKHSPEILTGIGVAGMITTTVLAVKATPKALELIDNARAAKDITTFDEKNKYVTYKDDKPYLTPLEIIKVAWKPYIPAISLGVASVTCIIGASAVNHKRNAALATAYAISERTLLRYRDKVVETIGEKKEKEVREKVAQDEVNNKPISSSQVILTPKGNTLCMDSISGRYFRSDIDKIKKVINELNRQMTHQNYISLDEFYSEIGLESTKNSSYLGWNLDDGLIEVDFSACIAEDDQPCIVVDYMVAPRYEYDKLM